MKWHQNRQEVSVGQQQREVVETIVRERPKIGRNEKLRFSASLQENEKRLVQQEALLTKESGFD